MRTGDVGDLGQIDDGGRDVHVDVHVPIRDQGVPPSVLSSEVELLSQKSGHVGIT